LQSDLAHLLGWWQLVTCDVEFRDSGCREPMFSAPAQGHIVFTADGRMMTVIQSEGSGVVAYSGRYQLEADRWITQVDVASIPGWTGTAQARSFRIDAGQLHVSSDWLASPRHGGRTIRPRIVWKRLEA
jgi:hypothetical protein